MINISGSYRYSLVLSFFACDRRSFTNTIKSKNPLVCTDMTVFPNTECFCRPLRFSAVLIIAVVDVLVTLVAKQGAVVISHEISNGDYW